MALTDFQRDIVNLIKSHGRMELDEILDELEVTKSEIASDLALLTSLEILGKRNDYGYFYQGTKNYILFADLLKAYPVENIMSMPVIIEETISIYDAIVTMFLENVGSIYVTSDGILVGVVSRKDLLRSAIGTCDLENTPVTVPMTRMPNLQVVEADTSVFDCAKKIVDAQIDGVPVVEPLDGKNKYKVIGRVTKTNITNFFVRMGYDYNVEELI